MKNTELVSMCQVALMDYFNYPSMCLELPRKILRTLSGHPISLLKLELGTS
jgi:hypothetical protein